MNFVTACDLCPQTAYGCGCVFGAFSDWNTYSIPGIIFESFVNTVVSLRLYYLKLESSLWGTRATAGARNNRAGYWVCLHGLLGLDLVLSALMTSDSPSDLVRSGKTTTSLKIIQQGKTYEQSDDQTGCKHTSRLAKLTWERKKRWNYYPNSQS